MSTDPSILALGSLLELCQRHSRVIQLLVSNPAALDSLSKYPEQALAALTGLDAAQDPDELEVRLLSTTTIMSLLIYSVRALTV